MPRSRYIDQRTPSQGEKFLPSTKERGLGLRTLSRTWDPLPDEGALPPPRGPVGGTTDLSQTGFVSTFALVLWPELGIGPRWTRYATSPPSAIERLPWIGF